MSNWKYCVTLIACGHDSSCQTSEARFTLCTGQFIQAYAGNQVIELAARKEYNIWLAEEVFKHMASCKIPIAPRAEGIMREVSYVKEKSASPLHWEEKSLQ